MDERDKLQRYLHMNMPETLDHFGRLFAHAHKGSGRNVARDVQALYDRFNQLIRLTEQMACRVDAAVEEAARTIRKEQR